MSEYAYDLERVCCKLLLTGEMRTNNFEGSSIFQMMLSIEAESELPSNRQNYLPVSGVYDRIPNFELFGFETLLHSSISCYNK